MNEKIGAQRLRQLRETWQDRCIRMMTNPLFGPAERQICRLKLLAFPFVCAREFDRALEILSSDPSLCDHPYCLQAIAHVLQAGKCWEPLVGVRTHLLEFFPEDFQSWIDLAQAVEHHQGALAAVQILREGEHTGALEFQYLTELCRLECNAGNLAEALEVEQRIRSIAPELAALLQADENFRPLWRFDPESQAIREATEDVPPNPEDFLPERGFL